MLKQKYKFFELSYFFLLQYLGSKVIILAARLNFGSKVEFLNFNDGLSGADLGLAEVKMADLSPVWTVNDPIH